jgi:hypothetical protein
MKCSRADCDKEASCSQHRNINGIDYLFYYCKIHPPIENDQKQRIEAGQQ